MNRGNLKKTLSVELTDILKGAKLTKLERS